MNLTDIQREALRQLVQHASIGDSHSDDLVIQQSKSGTFINGKLYGIEVTEGTVVVLEREGYLHISFSTRGRQMVTLTQKAYDAVDNDFAEGPEPKSIPTSSLEPEEEAMLKVFICHSRQDSEFAKLLVGLIKPVFRLSSDDIRCTSVEGYKLTTGASTDEELRTEVFGAKAFVALITPKSLESPYVLFELGGRWGSRKPLFPLLGGGLNESDIDRPLSSLTPMSCSSRGDLLQLVTDLGKCLGVVPDKPAAYQDQIDLILEYEQEAAQTRRGDMTIADTQQADRTEGQLSDDEDKILVFLTIERYGRALDAICFEIGCSSTRTQFYLDRLIDREFIADSFVMGEEPTYELARGGRDYLVKRDLI